MNFASYVSFKSLQVFTYSDHFRFSCSLSAPRPTWARMCGTWETLPVSACSVAGATHLPIVRRVMTDIVRGLGPRTSAQFYNIHFPSGLLFCLRSRISGLPCLVLFDCYFLTMLMISFRFCKLSILSCPFSNLLRVLAITCVLFCHFVFCFNKYI